MNNYRVTVIRNISKEYTFHVRAEGKQQAKDEAILQAVGIDWDSVHNTSYSWDVKSIHKD